MLAAVLLAGVSAIAGPTTDTTFVIEPGSQVVIEHALGNVEVRGTRGREARVLVAGEPSGARISRSGSVYHIGAGPFWEDEVSSLLVEVPRDVEVVVNGLDGDVRVTGVANDVVIETIEGTVEVAGAADVHAQTIDGDVVIEDASGAVWVHAGDGDVRIDGVAGPIEARAIEGDIRMVGSEADEVRVSTVSGDLWYEGRLASGGEYALGTHDGDIVLVVPQGTGAHVSAITFDGGFEPSFPVQLRSSRGGATEFTVGDGGARVSLESFDGDIYLIRPGESVPESR